MKPLMFLKNFITDKDIASVAPSSRFSVNKLCKKIDFNKNNVIVEYGPGTGVITYPLLRRMNKNSKLIVLEQNKNFCRHLKKNKDPRFIVENDVAQNVQEILKKHGVEKADYIISGIPLSFFPNKEKSLLMRQTYNCLNPQGRFLVYQFSRHAEKYLEKNFDYVKKDFELLNIPPLAIFEAIKKN
ncbi:MAG: class I SAM-dependent methyltransferase [Candidatus Nanoarchaeia archaeon]